jgi:WD40 repeat protein
VTTQLIAHENHAVYDISYEYEPDKFATAGEDGTIRLFDLKDLNHSTIIFESDKPLQRVAQNMNDPNQLAVIEEGGQKVILIDKRKPYHKVGYLN